MLQDQLAALKFFQRALQLDPTFTYAYTLAGHENLALEQFDKSMACFRNAMRLDPRHYNAWCPTPPPPPLLHQLHPPPHCLSLVFTPHLTLLPALQSCR